MWLFGMEQPKPVRCMQVNPEELRGEIQTMVDSDASKQHAARLREQISRLGNRQAAYDLHVEMGRLLAAKYASLPHLPVCITCLLLPSCGR